MAVVAPSPSYYHTHKKRKRQKNFFQTLTFSFETYFVQSHVRLSSSTIANSGEKKAAEPSKKSTAAAKKPFTK